MDLKGSKTEKNLMEAFAGESQARNKYTYFASKAKKDGYEQIAAIFEETANNEKEHAKLWFKYLEGGEIKDTKANPETVFNAFFEFIGNALIKSGRFDSKINRRKDIASFTDTKYLVENKILNDEKAKSKIMKTFDTMINKKVSDNARAEINNIIEKLVNCKP